MRPTRSSTVKNASVRITAPQKQKQDLVQVLLVLHVTLVELAEHSDDHPVAFHHHMNFLRGTPKKKKKVRRQPRSFSL